MRCSQCDQEHELLDPTFRRPDAVVALDEDVRGTRTKESDDACAMWATEDDQHRYFVRCTLPVRLLDQPGDSRWGLWAEVHESDFRRILELWSDPKQADAPPVTASVANRIPGYPDTIGLPAELRLTGPTSRPDLRFAEPSHHPFVEECRRGVHVHRVIEWLESLG